MKNLACKESMDYSEFLNLVPALGVQPGLAFFSFDRWVNMIPSIKQAKLALYCLFVSFLSRNYRKAGSILV